MCVSDKKVVWRAEECFANNQTHSGILWLFSRVVVCWEKDDDANEEGCACA